MGKSPSSPPDPGVPARVDVEPVLRELGELFRAAGHELYLVGGAVRDRFLNRERPDAEVDLATDALPDETIAVTRHWSDTRHLGGVRFGTVGVRRGGRLFEITTFRQEVYPEEERKPAVTFGKDVVVDLSRRDFTVNAMAVRLPEGDFLDPFGGLKGLAAKVLDTPLGPETAFTDDPLRMLRAVRFASTLDFVPAPRVIRALESMRERLSIVSAERVQQELTRLLLGEHPAKGLELLCDSGLAEQFIPELPALRLEQDPVHKHKDVLRHTLAVVERCQADLRLRLAALLHDVGKPKTRRITSAGVQFHHHEVVGARMAEERLRALRYPNDVVENVRKLVEMHLRFHTYRMGWSDGAVRRYVRDAGPLLDRLNQLTRADCTTANLFKAKQLAAAQDELEQRIARLAMEENLDAMRPPLDGNQVMAHLGIPPGPLVGKALAHLMEIRLERGLISEEDARELLDEWARDQKLDR
jgi:poly(A) polymerase